MENKNIASFGTIYKISAIITEEFEKHNELAIMQQISGEVIEAILLTQDLVYDRLTGNK